MGSSEVVCLICFLAAMDCTFERYVCPSWRLGQGSMGQESGGKGWKQIKSVGNKQRK